jgi:hypothetical protein
MPPTLGGWLHFALMVIGVTYLLTHASIATPFRVAFARGSWFRTALIYCPMCVSFWVGLALGPMLGVGTMYLDAGFCAMAITHVWFFITEQGVNPAWGVEEAMVQQRVGGEEADHAEEEKESTHG